MSAAGEKVGMWGLVLAGGRSKRMGMDKAGMLHPDGRYLARRSYDLLVEAGCERVVVSLRQGQDVPPGFEDVEGLVVVRDAEDAESGPLDGLHAAMRLEAGVDWLVVACDLPRLDVGTLRALMNGRKDGEMFLSYRSEFDGLPEPLCAVYGVGALDVIEKEMAVGSCCPRRILITYGCRLLEPVVEGALHNANTPDEWKEAF